MSKYSLGQLKAVKANFGQVLLNYAVLIIFSIIFLVPLFWMICTAFKTPDQTFNHPEIFFPDPWTIQNFIEMFQHTPVLTFVKNSCIVTILSILGAVISTSLAAYAFGRLKWKYREVVFSLVMIGMMVPKQAIMIPLYLVFQKLGLVNSIAPLIIPSWFAASTKCAFYIFTIRQFIMTIPHEVDEAAQIDGCGIFRIYIRIIIPLLKPVLGTVMVFSFMENWNNFLDAIIYLNDESQYTLAIGIQYFQMQNFTDWNKIMCVSLISIIPVVLVFFFGQKYFVKGINLSASKG